MPQETRQLLDQLADTAKAAQQTVAEVKRAHTDLDGRIGKLQEEMKSGLVDATTKAAYQDAVEKVALHEKSLERLNAEVTELAQKAANLHGSTQQRKSLGQLAAECGLGCAKIACSCRDAAALGTCATTVEGTVESGALTMNINVKVATLQQTVKVTYSGVKQVEESGND